MTFPFALLLCLPQGGSDQRVGLTIAASLVSGREW